MLKYIEYFKSYDLIILYDKWSYIITDYDTSYYSNMILTIK